MPSGGVETEALRCTQASLAIPDNGVEMQCPLTAATADSIKVIDPKAVQCRCILLLLHVACNGN